MTNAQIVLPINNFEDIKKKLISSLNNIEFENTQNAKRNSIVAYRNEYVKLKLTQKPYLLSNEKHFKKFIISGIELKIDLINPIIHICKSREDFDIHDFFSMWSSFPTRDRPGRRFKFLLLDKGQYKPSIMAIGCLSSCLRQMKVRDEWIGWNDKAFRKIKTKNLAYIMELSTCVGIPPYSLLTSGKLLCYTILSKEFRGMYYDRYHDQLTRKLKRKISDIALLVTCGAFSSNTAQYNGISVNKTNYLKFIGYTKGYSTFQVNQEMYNYLIERLGDKLVSKSRYREGGGNAKIRMLRNISRILNVDEEKIVFSGHKRSIYVCALAQNWREFLLGNSSKLDYYDFDIQTLIEEWKSKWLKRRTLNSEVVKKVRSFNPDQFSFLQPDQSESL